MSDYPFLKKIREKLSGKDETLGWLTAQIDRSERFVTGITAIDKVNVGDVINISRALDFDFMADYFTWLGRDIPKLTIVSEPDEPYFKESKEDISITIKIRGKAENAGKVLSAIKEVSKKEGFKVE